MKLTDAEVSKLTTKIHYFCGQMLPSHWRIFVKEGDLLREGQEIGYAPAYAKTPEGFLFWENGGIVIRGKRGVR